MAKWKIPLLTLSALAVLFITAFSGYIFGIYCLGTALQRADPVALQGLMFKVCSQNPDVCEPSKYAK